jgi:hypothetical protein
MQRETPLPGTLSATLRRLREAWPKRGWSWDGRLTCVASSFGMDVVSEARTAILYALPHEWTHRSVRSAPPSVIEVADATGGLRPDQILFASDPVEATFAYGLWWPWGDDVTISMRIGLVGRVRESAQQSFRELFGATFD